MNTITASAPSGEVLRSTIDATAAASAFRSRPFGFGSKTVPSSGPLAEPLALRRHPHIIRYAEVEADFDVLIDRAVAAIAEGEPIEDEILGHYVNIASLVRAVSFREGKLLEQAVERLAKANPDITVLTQSIKLPLVKAAIEAVANNGWRNLEGVQFDCEAPAKGTYTPDLIVVNRAKHGAFILDLKRSLASYGDTSRLDELKLKMMASAMILPDWLYKNRQRLMVDMVGVAIVDGASRPSDHEHGVWALSEIDDLLEIDGAAVCMAELRLRFGRRVQRLLEAEARKALAIADPVPVSGTMASSPARRRPFPNLNGGGRGAVMGPEVDAFDPFYHDECDVPDDGGEFPESDEDDGRQASRASQGPESSQDPQASQAWPPARIRVGFARRFLDA